MYFLSYLPAYLCVLLLNKFIYLVDIFILQYPVDFLGDFKFLWKFTFFKFVFGAGEIDYWARELNILPKGPSSIPSTYMVACNLCDSGSKDTMPSPGLSEHQVHMQAYI